MVDVHIYQPECVCASAFNTIFAIIITKIYVCLLQWAITIGVGILIW